MAKEVTEKQSGNSPNKPWQFQPGQSGNPNGRPPKGQAISDVMREMMDEKPEIKKALSQKLLQMALNGDIAAIREIFDRIEGKPKQAIDHSTLGEKFGGVIVLPEQEINAKRVDTTSRTAD